jgi:hypothetical protein
VGLRDLSHEGQTDAIARAIPDGSVGLSTREAVEQRFHGAWVDAHSVVTHIDEDVVIVPSEDDRNRSAAVLVCEGVVDEGGNRATKRRSRPANDEIANGHGARHGAIRFYHEVHAGRFGVLSHALIGCSHH